ncbi:hypothetical protein NP233_g1228 [Leucocoprinus birnbaumii]|uniref:N-acetyltransferase domain-containing protein n=1 Tax=Leucocoprinus birnbaumii TaxID=56174 RepID=A0AAD5W0Q5_9AGAR|nr:hypothetical protein NP233_g1228 [Leucocoprinus birnbaumii]
MLRLRKHANIVITPPRETDIPEVIPHLNDERIHLWLTTAYPYTVEHARTWNTRIISECQSGLHELNAALKDTTSPKPIVLNQLPVRVLRELQEDGTDKYIGDIGCIRCSEVDLLGRPELTREKNSSLPAGHRDIVWTFGDWLIPSYHGKGIMTDAVDTVIRDLAQPLLGAFHFVAAVFSGNEGSSKVFLKNGFAHENWNESSFTLMNRLGPFEVNPRTQEPMIRLRKHPNIVITPPRESDIPKSIPHFNDERVNRWLNTAYPFTAEHAKERFSRKLSDCELGLQELHDALSDPMSTRPIILSCLPVRALREIQEDGTEQYIGDIGCKRCPEVELLGNPKLSSEVNSSLPAGHPNIVWSFGDWLAASHHGKGIMTDAVDTMIQDLAQPLLGATHFTAMIYSGNEGSSKVFLKNGFAHVRCVKNHRVVRGFSRDVDVYELRLDRTFDKARALIFVLFPFSSTPEMIQIGPLEINPLTEEPFLRLRKHPNVIITPPRLTDAPLLVHPLNDEKVHVWLSSPPYPYTLDHASQFIDIVKPNCDRGIQELSDAGEEHKPLVLSQCPVRFLREIQEDGSDVFLGDISIDRCAEVEDLMENTRVTNTANLSLPPGHPEIIWTIGCE